MEKREIGSNILCPIIFRLLGRISSGPGKGEGDGIFWEENQDLKNGGGVRI